MKSDLLFQHINQHIQLTADEKDYVSVLLQHKKLKRKQILYQEGDIHKYLVFVTEGCLRSYSIDHNGFEHILQFAPPGWWIGDMHSFNTQTSGVLNIDAVDKSEIIMIARADVDKLYLEIPKFERMFRILAENSIATYQHRMIDSLSLTAMERYDNFCKTYPSLIQCLPQKQVAAYIGVTPEFLSKMLNRPVNA
jgi:CRP-like cAMP-binding protein